ncbi:SDR family oxidoreductase [Sphingomonas sp. BIUV-7]|uniref:SDR family oxidoreductase n=1 Tax=Sphingomonas natans TaxID=3063330 RepID=A0ABT8Y8B5_9SPHN|nr:SDR family oxidoreductase [Sphingomonas sp. BIUV-7]MDO6414565.1 SDR family oxidoreductase [Sphingomonas sp. BIUV-7]
MHETLIRDFAMDGRVAVVTGAGSGIGQEAACVLAEAGADLVLADINADGLAETARLVRERGRTAAPLPVDIADRSAVDDLADAAVQALGKVDAWVNGAGILHPFAILEAEEATLDRLLNINLKGTYWGCAAAGRVMKPRGGGAIVNISSAAADNPVAALSGYAMTKASINMLTRTAAVEFGSFNCRVNAIAPGFVETALVAGAYCDEQGRIDPERREAFLRDRAAATPLGTTGRPRDIALAILYLVSDASRFVTGQVLRPNGGVVMP